MCDRQICRRQNLEKVAPIAPHGDAIQHDELEESSVRREAGSETRVLKPAQIASNILRLVHFELLNGHYGPEHVRDRRQPRLPQVLTLLDHVLAVAIISLLLLARTTVFRFCASSPPVVVGVRPYASELVVALQLPKIAPGEVVLVFISCVRTPVAVLPTILGRTALNNLHGVELVGHGIDNTVNDLPCVADHALLGNETKAWRVVLG